jgi:hypothetical protein
MMKNVSCAVAAFALLSAASGLAQAQDGVVLDYTKRSFRDAQPAVAAADKTRVTSALASAPSDAVKALGKNLVLLGHAKGKTAKAGTWISSCCRRSRRSPPSPPRRRPPR